MQMRTKQKYKDEFLVNSCIQRESASFYDNLDIVIKEHDDDMT